ncbi:MAG: hypothetical protein DMG46_05180 [Acidobacteria bacterium]|nr:MAG: hypothetical protein DMG46_05180 [Acidobacteriota bacterium]
MFRRRAHGAQRSRRRPGIRWLPHRIERPIHRISLARRAPAGCAVPWSWFRQLIYLTDVAGVLDGERVLSAVTCEEIERLVQCRVVSGGMVLKLEAAKRAIEGGVREVRIVGGTSSDALLLASHAAETSPNDGVASIPGTRVLREPLSAAQAALSAA